jgi:hypothetical protein
MHPCNGPRSHIRARSPNNRLFLKIISTYLSLYKGRACLGQTKLPVCECHNVSDFRGTIRDDSLMVERCTSLAASTANGMITVESPLSSLWESPGIHLVLSLFPPECGEQSDKRSNRREICPTFKPVRKMVSGIESQNCCKSRFVLTKGSLASFTRG